MHHDERWWEDAECFKPERWLGDKTGGDKSGGLAYLPFGAGPRMCIGIKLAGTTFPSSDVPCLPFPPKQCAVYAFVVMELKYALHSYCQECACGAP